MLYVCIYKINLYLSRCKFVLFRVWHASWFLFCFFAHQTSSSLLSALLFPVRRMWHSGESLATRRRGKFATKRLCENDFAAGLPLDAFRESDHLISWSFSYSLCFFPFLSLSLTLTLSLSLSCWLFHFLFLSLLCQCVIFLLPSLSLSFESSTRTWDIFGSAAGLLRITHSSRVIRNTFFRLVFINSFSEHFFHLTRRSLIRQFWRPGEPVILILFSISF